MQICKRILLPFLLLCFINSNAQNNLPALQDSLNKYGKRMFKGNDAEKLNAHLRFTAFMRTALEQENVFEFPFDSLKFIARLNAPDNAFRIFNWNIPQDDGTHKYYGFILVDQDAIQGRKNKKSKLKNQGRYVAYELTDQSDFIKTPEMAILSCDKWYGALYYKIIMNSYKGKKYYTLLGWDGNNKLTWKKVIDVLTFSREGLPVFGEEMMFQVNRLSKRRVIFEFKAELIMTLKYEEKKQRIVFDHLAPEVSGAEGMYQFYVQTFSYDTYNFKKGKWVYKPDEDIRNPKSKKDDIYNAPDNGPK
jgi:hypothetical protein